MKEFLDKSESPEAVRFRLYPTGVSAYEVTEGLIEDIKEYSRGY